MKDLQPASSEVTIRDGMPVGSEFGGMISNEEAYLDISPDWNVISNGFTGG